MNTRPLIAGALAALFGLSITLGNASAQYKFTELGAPPGLPYSCPCAINAAGQVAGWAENSSGSIIHAFLYSNSTMQDLGTLPGGATSQAYAINDSGQVVGFSETSGGTERAFLYSNGTMLDLGTLGGADANASAINTSGQIVGWADTSSGASAAFLYSGGTMTQLPGLEGAFLINDDSQVVGWSTNTSYLWIAGTATKIPGGATAIKGMNDAGQVVGSGPTSDAFLWSSATGAQNLGTLPAPFNTGSRADGINLSGQIVGTSWACPAPGDFQYHAFIYSNGTIEDLNNLTSLPAGLTLVEATAINNSGQIVGDASNGDAFLLTPLERGDANADGRVDINDLTIVLSNFGQTGMTWSQGNFTGDPTVDINDLTIVLSNYGYGVTAAAGVKAVPEPASLVLLLAALACLLATMRRSARGKPWRLARRL